VDDAGHLNRDQHLELARMGQQSTAAEEFLGMWQEAFAKDWLWCLFIFLFFEISKY
jgi:hypothetical protein